MRALYFFIFFLDFLCVYAYKDGMNNGKWFPVKTNRGFIRSCEGYLEQDQDYTSEVVQVDDDFDFENQNIEGWDL